MSVADFEHKIYDPGVSFLAGFSAKIQLVCEGSASPDFRELVRPLE
jgi:hypothetical protein